MQSIQTNPIIAPHLNLLTKTRGAEHVSDRYKPITTLDVIEHFCAQGFTPNRVVAPRTNNDVEYFGRHEVILNMPQDLNYRLKDSNLVPRLHVKNSFDAKSSLKFYLGVFRLVCSNGLVVGDGLFFETLRHVGNININLNNALNRSSESIALVSDAVNRWTSIQLNSDQAHELARRIMQLRMPKDDTENKVTYSVSNLARVLKPRRTDDLGTDLFTVFNRIQENTVERPSAQYIRTEITERGYEIRQVRRLGRVSDLMRTKANSDIWNLTEAFYREVA